MSAPKYVPVPTTDKARSYESPDVVPEHWEGRRPGELEGPQPEGTRLGFQGPDQGYALKLAEERIRPRLQLSECEHADDAISGCVGIAMRRASLYGRAPVIHDLTIAFTIWGYLDAEPPGELVALRRAAFEGVGHIAHHYAEARAIADGVPEATLRMTAADAQSAYPSRWRDLLGV
jgi:hypothetical protein